MITDDDKFWEEMKEILAAKNESTSKLKDSMLYLLDHFTFASHPALFIRNISTRMANYLEDVSVLVINNISILLSYFGGELRFRPDSHILGDEKCTWNRIYVAEDPDTHMTMVNCDITLTNDDGVETQDVYGLTAFEPLVLMAVMGLMKEVIDEDMTDWQRDVGGDV